MINFVKHKKKYLIFSGFLVLASIISILFFGFNFGIELAGGSIMEIEYEEERPPIEEVRESLRYLGDFQVQEMDEDAFLLRTTETGEDVYRNIMNALDGATERYFESIGPAVGRELRNMTILAMILASVFIIIYIAFSFAKTSGPISSWQYGVIATGIAFFHDVLIILGVFAVLGHFYGVPFTIPIVVALLTTLGYSLNDTVVIFDRIRENLERINEGFEETINSSLNQTITRSINTSLTTLLVLLSLLFFGGDTLFYFALALILGVVLGTFSSIFLASSLLLTWKNKLD